MFLHYLCVHVPVRSQIGRGRPFVFFFQAEDGIRDLVRSRGLGDVYKRQMRDLFVAPKASKSSPAFAAIGSPADLVSRVGQVTVSYTHLTLPTSDLV